jgi:predicted ATPase
MFTQLSLKNFKAWRDVAQTDESGTPRRSRIDIPLAPVTMLLGTNSSGKSSLLQALLLLKQTVASPDRSIHLNLGGNEANDYFNFGHFEDVLSRNASPRQFEIGFRFSRPEAKSPSEKRRVMAGEFAAVYGMTSTGGAAVQEMALSSDLLTYRAIRRDKGAYSIFVGQEAQPRGKSRSYAPERSIAFPAEVIQLLAQDGPAAEDISLAVRRELEGIAYLGPLRRKPERDYPWNKTKPGEIGIDGSDVINAILASALSRSKEDDTAKIIQSVSDWLNRMGVADRIEVKQLGHSTRYEVVVHKDGIAANLRDVGIGVSQVLPVITLAFFAPPGSTVLLEEPEIHLHPLAQSVLAELFMEVSRTRQVQFIVETHSEHLFRRLQTLVARGTASIDDCTLYFVEREGADAILKPLLLDEHGRVQDWPPLFFGDAMGETREQAKLMFERQQRAANR